MFTFIHPKPFNQRAVAMQVVARKTEALPELHVLVVETRPRSVEVIQGGHLARQQYQMQRQPNATPYPACNSGVRPLTGITATLLPDLQVEVVETRSRPAKVIHPGAPGAPEVSH